jgi:uncharacterized protein
MVGWVESVWRYPVKSMRGEELAEAFLGYGGVFGDRRYGFVSSAAPADFPYFTSREQHRMLLHRPVYSYPEKMARPNGELSPADWAIEVETPSGDRLTVEDFRLIELLREGVAERHHVTLIQSEDAIVDSRPISLFSLQTVRQLSGEVGVPLDKRRFRANLYVDLASGGGFTEDSWVGRKLAIGEEVVIEVLKRNKRCKLITLDPDTAEPDPDVMKRVAHEHESCAGIYAKALVEGIVVPGGEVRLVA